MKVLLVHNFYQQPGGEDLVFNDEARLLESHGHETIRYTAHNDNVHAMSALTLGRRTVWNNKARHDVRQVIARERPHLVHVHNTLPLLSPAVYYAASAEGVPIVQTLHNYRLICPAGLCFRDGRVCTVCVGKSIAWPAVCTAATGQPTRQCRNRDDAVGTPSAAHLGAKSQGLHCPDRSGPEDVCRGRAAPAQNRRESPISSIPIRGGSGSGGYALFVVRLSAEKGLQTLLEAWRRVHGQVRLLVVGDGPLAPDVTQAAENIPGVTWLGRRDPPEIQSLLRDAMCLVFPSEGYETFGRVVIEAFAAATPVIAAGHGAAAELVQDGLTGLHFRPGDPSDLAAKVWKSS